MSFTQTAIGVAAISTLIVGGLGAVIPTPEGKQPFMTVGSIAHGEGRVIVDRTVYGADAIADWRVVIVSQHGKAPSCATIPGARIHEGWSDYSAGREVNEMSLDEWVNDPGCYERLRQEPGTYQEHITWTPRDGRAPTTFVGDIEIEGPSS